MKDLEDKLKNLTNQKDQAYALFMKLQGAIEFIETLLEEENTPKKDKK
tara:strand:+ start:51 stop:194 length:144 start_codon:yes stop_codon:yes gene_type:complete